VQKVRAAFRVILIYFPIRRMGVQRTVGAVSGWFGLLVELLDTGVDAIWEGCMLGCIHSVGMT